MKVQLYELKRIGIIYRRGLTKGVEHFGHPLFNLQTMGKIIKNPSLTEMTKKGKKAARQDLLSARKEALELAYKNGYITKDEMEKGMQLPTRFTKKHSQPKTKQKVTIYYGYNTISK